MKTFEQIYKEANQNKLQEAWGEDRKIGNQNLCDVFSSLFNELVPSQGPAQNMFGEIVRAVNRICYRKWNDGDIFYDGYGIETCGNAAEFLNQYGGQNIKSILNQMLDLGLRSDDIGSREDKYDTFCEDLMESVVKFDKTEKSRLIQQSVIDFQSDIYFKKARENFGDPWAEEEYDEYEEENEDDDY
jgi:hypothetical protein